MASRNLSSSKRRPQGRENGPLFPGLFPGAPQRADAVPAASGSPGSGDPPGACGAAGEPLERSPEAGSEGPSEGAGGEWTSLLDTYVHKRGANSASLPGQPPGQPRFTDDDEPEDNEPLAKRLKRFGKGVAWARGMADYLRDYYAVPIERGPTEGLQRARRLETCGNFLLFRRLLDGSNRNILHKAIYCQQYRLCPFCAMLRAARLIRKYAGRICRQVVREGLDPLFGTHTIRTGYDAAERFDHLKSCLQKIMKRRQKTLAGQRGYASPMVNVVGGIRQIEIKLQKDEKWHVHAHGLYLVNGRLDWRACGEEWATTADDAKMVLFKRLNSVLAFEKGTTTPEEFHRQLASDLVEIIKYPVKFGNVTHAQAWSLFQDLGPKRRVFESFGSCRSDDDETKEYLERAGIDWSIVPYVELVYRYAAGNFNLVETREPVVPSQSQGGDENGKPGSA